MKSEVLYNIHISVDGVIKTISGVTTTTTCDDVIRSLEEAAGEQGSCEFGIFEFSCTRERLLPGRTKILKAIRGWGTGSGQFGLVLRQIDHVQSTKNVFNLKKKFQKLKKKYSFHSVKIDDKMLKVVTRKHNDNRDVVISKEGTNYNTSVHLNQTSNSMAAFLEKVDTDNMADFLRFYKVMSRNGQDYVRNAESIDHVTEDTCMHNDTRDYVTRDQTAGKQELLKRFIASSNLRHKHDSMADLSLSLRSCGYGEEGGRTNTPTRVDNDQANIERFNYSDVDINSDYGSADLDEAFVYHCDVITANSLEDCESSYSDAAAAAADDDDELNMCHLAESMIETILNTSFCDSESDEGWESTRSYT